MTQIPNRAISEAAEDALRETLGRWRVEHRVPGAALVVADATGRATSIVDGQADVEHGAALHPAHRLEIGSISKSFTAIVVLRLATRGLLDVDAPIRRSLPWFRAGGDDRAITLHDLLCHASGLPNGADLCDRSAIDAWMLRDQDAEPPGRYWYSNAGYKVLGLVIERVTGRPYPEVVADEVLEPLGMTESHPAVRFADRSGLATGYEPEPGTYPVPTAPNVPAPFIEVNTADGSVASTAADMGRYVAALLAADDGRSPLLPRGIFERLVGRHVRIDGSRGYGYGLWTDRVHGQRLFGHGGDMLGFRSSMVCNRDAGVGVVVLANHRGAPTPQLGRHALQVAVADRAGQALPDLEPAEREDPRPWAGRYDGPSGTLEIRVVDGEPWLTLDDADHSLIPGVDGRFDVAHPDIGRYPLRCRRTRQGRVAVHGARIFGDPLHAAGGAPSAAGERRRRRLTGRFEAHNPWRRSFDVVARSRQLVLIEAEGEEEPLRPLAGDRFRVGSSWSPERLAFDAVVDGQALRATASGHPYFRTRG